MCRHVGAHVVTAGDNVGSLMWRLLNGELPALSPMAMVFQVGSSDISGSSCTDKLAAIALERLDYLLTHVHNVHPTSEIVIMGLLPKGVRFAKTQPCFRSKVSRVLFLC
jgi:hypothetical protein